MSGQMIGYLDLAGGLSGDMFLACCLEAGVRPEELTGLLRALPLGPWSLEDEVTEAFGLRARRVRFRTDPSPPHRSYALIRDRIIGPAELPGRVRERALAALAALARAEAAVHGREVEEVHFHEVGADDSILDLVGAAACLDLLDVGELRASPVPLSRGVGQAGHGLLPLPAPATLRLLEGKPVAGAGSRTELVTPTGAAILTWAAAFGELPAMKLAAVGTGLGGRPPQNGLTRLFLGQPVGGLDAARLHQVSVVTTTIDDMNPELFGPLIENLLKQGALDAVLIPVQMKKNRPGVRLEVLAAPEAAGRLADFILEETSTLGVRIREERRLCLERREGSVTIEAGSVAGKWVRRPSGRWDFRPEFEACRRLAGQTGQSIEAVYNQSLGAAAGKEP